MEVMCNSSIIGSGVSTASAKSPLPTWKLKNPLFHPRLGTTERILKMMKLVRMTKPVRRRRKKLLKLLLKKTLPVRRRVQMLKRTPMGKEMSRVTTIPKKKRNWGLQSLIPRKWLFHSVSSYKWVPKHRVISLSGSSGDQGLPIVQVHVGLFECAFSAKQRQLCRENTNASKVK